MEEKKRVGKAIELLLLLGGAVLCYEMVMMVVGATADLLAQMLSEEGMAWDKQYYLWDTLGCTWLLGIYGLWVFGLKQERQRKQQDRQRRWVQKEGKAEKGRTWKRVLEVTVITFGLGGISSLWLIFAGEVLYQVPVIGESVEQFQTVGEEQLKQPYIWVFLSVVLFGPIVEELLFRGIVYQYLAEIREGWFAVIASGALFGLWHREPVQVVYTMIMGVGIAIVYKKTGSLKYTIGLHVLNNLLSALPPCLETDAVMGVIGLLNYIMILPALYFLGRFSLPKNREQS